MRKYRKYIVVGMILALAAGFSSHAVNPERESVIAATYQVEWVGPLGLETGGNGFILCGDDGKPLVGVTAYHVATDASWQPLKMLQVRQYGAYVSQVEVFYHDSEADIALFVPPASAQSCIPFADLVTEEVTFFSGLAIALVRDREGNESILWSIPYWGQGGEVTACCQNLNLLVKNEIGNRWPRMVVANLVFSPGVSGSPVVYSTYKLAGIAVGMLNRDNGAVIVPAGDLRAALERARGQTGRPSQAAPPGMSRTKFAKKTPFALPEGTRP